MGNRVAVFIDHSNVHHLLNNMRKADPLWARWYNPLSLAEKLAGNRFIVCVYFYCAPPPSHLLNEGVKEKRQYWMQMGYYQEIDKHDKVTVKYARLEGKKGNLREKNLDTQLTADIIILAAQNHFDTAILVANDQDYVAAVKGVNQLGKRIELAYFEKSLSMHLKSVCNVSRKLRRSYFIDLSF